MSQILGGEALMEKFQQFSHGMQVELQAAFEANGKQLQTEAVAYVPVDTGNLRDLLAQPEALLMERRAFGPYLQFGFRTPMLRKKGYYALFVENGTKAHNAGEVVNPGTDKRSRSGRQRKGKRRKRSTPARPAQPFMRPAFERFKERMARVRGEALRKAAEGSGLKVKLWW